MLQLSTRSHLLIIATLLLPALSSAAESPSSPGPHTLSPGGSGRTEMAATSCPTLSWSYQGDASEQFEIAVFDGRQLTRAGLPASTASAITSSIVPGGARSWTPSVESCPPAGGTYAWTVRGLAEGRSTAWSAPRWFKTAAVPPRSTTADLMARLPEVLSTADEALPSPPNATVEGNAEPIAATLSTEGILEAGDLIAADGPAQGDIESDSSAASSALGALRARRLQLNSDSSGTAGAVLVAESSPFISRGQLRLEGPGTGQIEGRLTLQDVSTNWLEITGTAVLDVPWNWYPPGLSGGQTGSTPIELNSSEEVRLDTAGASCGNLPVVGVRLRETDPDQIGIQLLCGGTEGAP